MNVILRHFSNAKNNYKEKKEIINNMEFDFLKCNLYDMFRLSKKYTIEYMLYRFSLYKALFMLARLNQSKKFK